MLKIIDDFNLEKLKDYGFYLTPINTGVGKTVIQDNAWWFPSGLMIDLNSREILLHSGEYEKNEEKEEWYWSGKHTTILYDLIKDGIVEKVSDKDE